MGDNRSKTLNEVVSLEAWHDPFSKKSKKVDLHVDVAFLSGRLGGEDESEVRFVLELNQAEIVVIIPPGEPARVDAASVSRDTPRVEATVVQDRKVTKSAKAKVSAKAAASNHGASGGGSLGLAAGYSTDDRLSAKLTEAVMNMRLLHSLGSDQQHRWSVSTITKDAALQGRPWNAAEEPRLKVVDDRPDREKGLAPVVKVEVRCRREDLVISHIELKNVAGLGDRIKRDGRRNKEAAAEAIIRARLVEEGLLTGDIEDRFAVLTLASVMAQSD